MQKICNCYPHNTSLTTYVISFLKKVFVRAANIKRNKHEGFATGSKLTLDVVLYWKNRFCRNRSSIAE